MAITVAFDVYGTLIDTSGVIVVLQKCVGDKSIEFSEIWRQKQLEYSFRRGLMQNYAPFSVCTSNALDYTCEYLNVLLEQHQKDELLDACRVLPAFEDVEEGLIRSEKTGFSMYAFSNGSTDAVETLLKNASIRKFFLEVVSVDEMKSFKPNPGVYCHFLRRSGAVGADAWLVSSNPFDIIGAVSAGMRAAWVRRFPEIIFDPWGIEPTITVRNLTELAAGIYEESNKE
ncbi:MAG: haloacid dehalogenase type II [Acidobacteriota bacterium]